VLRSVVSLRTGLVVLFVGWIVAWAPSASAAPATESVDASAMILKVETGKKPRITISKGKKAGVKMGIEGEVYPMRLAVGGRQKSVDWNVRLALGKVVELKDDMAVVALDAVADTIEVGGVFSYSITAPEVLAQSALFRTSTLGIDMRMQNDDKLFITTEDMLADPSDALRNKALDAMIADVKNLKEIVVEALKERIEEGEHHGKTAGQVIDGLDRRQMLDFLVFVEAFPGLYIGHRWKLPEVFFTWVINGTPSGERDRRMRVARKDAKLAYKAMEEGKFPEARAHWQTVLKLVPDHKAAADNIVKIDKIMQLTRTASSDPDDTTSGYTLADELYNIEAYPLALKALEPLRKRKYEPKKVDKLYAMILVRLERFAEAEPIFKRQLKDAPDDKNLEEWVGYTRIKAKVKKSPNDVGGWYDLANFNIKYKAWDAALTNYRKVLAHPKATPAQKEVAKAAQQRIATQKEIDHKRDGAKDMIKRHDLKAAREKISQVLTLIAQLKDDAQAGDALEALAEAARVADEEELALELFTRWAQLIPTSIQAHQYLAFALLGFDRIDEAETAAKKSLEQKGDAAYSYLLLAYVARAREDFTEMEKHVKKAISLDAKYGWAMSQMARVAAIRGDWDEAVEWAKKALAVLPDEYEMRTTHVAVHRGQLAAVALQSNANQPRERLRLARAYATLGLPKQTAAEIAKLPADGTWRSDAWQALADTADTHVLLKDKVAAWKSGAPTIKQRKRKQEIQELRLALRTSPKDDAKRIQLASLYLMSEDWSLAQATLVPLMAKTPIDPKAGDIVHNAHRAVDMVEVMTQARAAFTRQDYDTSLRLGLEAKKLFDSLGTSYGPIGAREIVADALEQKADHKAALAMNEEVLKLSTDEGEPSNISIAKQRVGRAKGITGAADEQRKALEEGRVVFEGLDDELSLFYCHLQIAQTDKDQGRSATSLENARKAWALAERLGRPDLARMARFELADANLVSSRFTDAEDVGKKLLVDSRKANDVYNEQLSLMVIGVVAMMRGNGPQARARFQEVYELGARTGNTYFRAVARKFDGSSYLLADHDAAKAAIALEQADALYATFGEGWATQERGVILRELADANLQAGKVAPARKAAEESLKLAERFQRTGGLASANWILSLIAVKEGKADDALKFAQKALAYAQQNDQDYMLWNAWYAMARANDLKKNDAAAIDAYENALTFVGKVLQASGGETEKAGHMNVGRVRQLYSDAVDRMLKAGKTQRAMEILELSRDAMLKQQFDPTKVQTKDKKVRARLDKIVETRDRVKGLQKQLQDAMDKPVGQRNDAQVKALSERIAKTKQEMNQVVLDLKVSHRQLFQALAMDPQNLVGRRELLPAGSVLVEYFVADDALYAFVIARNLSQPAVVRTKVTAAQLDEAIAEWRDAIVAENEKVRQRDKVEELGRKLEDWLLEPLRPHLEGSTALILIPFGSLYYVPFDALVVSEPGQPVKYAIEDYRISIQTATTLEHLLRPARPKLTGTMLAISNPDGSLPGAQTEVSRIVKTSLPDAKVLGNKAATVKKFTDLAGGFRYLHLATHGILDDDPRKSHMVFADGPLTVEKISQLQGLDTSNEMVVLSACDTAVEKGKSNGDELVSVAVAFSMAGSPALVASLWEVSDDSTVELMATFYKELEKGKGDRLDALREAKLSLMRMTKGTAKPFAQPWHWSSFQMYGDYRAPAPVAP